MATPGKHNEIFTNKKYAMSVENLTKFSILSTSDFAQAAQLLADRKDSNLQI